MIGEARSTVARWLEEGTLDVPLTRAIARVGKGAIERGLARPLHVPHGLATITVGGATLGGSGKTRVALACTRALARDGHDVVLVGHGHRAVLRGDLARVVETTDTVAEVGDEALACARSLDRDDAARRRARVVVGRSRQHAIDFAATLAPRPSVVVIDGPLQLAPRRSSLAILAVDHDAPWGSGEVVPAGDLRATPAALLALVDHRVDVASDLGAVDFEGQRLEIASFASLVEARGLKVGLFTAVARPGRIARALEAGGVRSRVMVRLPDHGPLSAEARAALLEAEVDLWTATEKCATHLTLAGITRPLAILRDDLSVEPALLSHMRALTLPKSRA